MKLLIVTQALDTEHPVLGFFHRWILEFSKHVEHVHVIAAHVGEYELPENVSVYSLGKERDTSKVYKTGELLRLSWSLRDQYDAVFVHMIPEFVLVAGSLWRMLGKHVGMWYMHKMVDTKLKLAESLVDDVFTASEESFRMPSKKLHIVGHGIDTDRFVPNSKIKREEHLLSVGRLMRSKRHDLAIGTAKYADKKLRIIGIGEEREHLETFAEEIGADVAFVGGLTQEELVEEYQKAHAFVHTSETGSLDKVVLEALACGCPVVTTNARYSYMPVTISEPSPEALAKEALKIKPSKKTAAYVSKNHSLTTLIPRIISVLER